MELTPQTELDAVNRILEAVGELPVATLPDEDAGINTEADIAQRALHRASRQIQSQGLPCNTVNAVVLTPDASTDKIAVATNVLSIDAEDTTRNIVRRGSYLYDVDNQTYEFSDAADSELEFTVIYFLDFEELPEPVRNYITVTALKSYQMSAIGSVTLHKVILEEVLAAKVEFERYVLNAWDKTLFNTAGTPFDIMKGFTNY